MKAYIHLICYALERGMSVSVYDGETWSVKKSVCVGEIKEEIEGVDEATLRFYDKDCKAVGSAIVSAYGLDDDETVIDHSENEFMDAWWKAYAVTI